MTALKTRGAPALVLTLLLGAAGMILASGVAASPPAGAPAALAAGALSPSSTIELEGHGYGHGRGMGQYGALGYAVNSGWSYQQILAHYYSNAQAGTYPNAAITVRLTALDGMTTAVTQEGGDATVSGQAGTYSSLEAVLVGPNTFQVYSGPSGCSGPWAKLGSPMAGPVLFSSSLYAPGTTNHSNLLQACVPGGTRWYRGQIESVDGGGTGNPTDQRTVNVVDMEDYLLGVVPSESPSSWGSMGTNNAGMNALEAQAVAARSYAAAQDRYGYARICDSTACQVYGGMAYEYGGVFQYVESANATAAVRDTAGQDLTLNGSPASAEYSASTGGYTAGGTFPAVADDGDSVSVNPYHTWTTSLTVADLEGAFPSIGGLESIQVTHRSGLGDFGGRVLSMELLGTQGTVTLSGDLFAAYFNLRSNWFEVVSPNQRPEGYWVVGADGGIFAFGSAGHFGSTAGTPLTRPVVGMAATADSQGYYLVATDGGIFSFGDAAFLGSTGSIRLNQPIVGMAIHADGASTANPTTGGYWMAASDGGIFSFGDAHFYGSTGSIHLNKPIVGMASTPDGGGYWLVASDGGIFAFGDAAFYGSTGSINLNKPIVGMAATPDGGGYWLVASDGGIFAFGDAAFYGSTGSITLSQPITGMQSTWDGQGYYMVARDGAIFAFGDAAFFGSVPGVDPGSTTTKVGMAVS